MFQIQGKYSALKSLYHSQFNFTSENYFSNIENSYRQRVINQRKILLDKTLSDTFVSNFRHPASKSIISDMQLFAGYKPVKINNKIRFNLLYDKNRSLQKKIKIEQLRRETR